MVSLQPKKPSTTTTVQPHPSKIPNSVAESISNAKSALLEKSSSISTDDVTKDKLPQVPPRVHSQTSEQPTRGPPPAIPPRNNIPSPTRSSSVQIAATSQCRPILTRQTSANSIQPQCTRQPAPKFVIPQRQNSRTSINRSSSISNPSSND